MANMVMRVIMMLQRIRLQRQGCLLRMGMVRKSVLSVMCVRVLLQRRATQ